MDSRVLDGFELGKCLPLLSSVFLLTTAALESPAGEGGEPALRRDCCAISGRPTSFPPKTPPSSEAVVNISFFPIT